MSFEGQMEKTHSAQEEHSENIPVTELNVLLPSHRYIGCRIQRKRTEPIELSRITDNPTAFNQRRKAHETYHDHIFSVPAQEEEREGYQNE